MSERFTGNGLSYWNVNQVYDFSYMFSETPVFNSNLSSWDVSNALIMDGMLCNTSTSFIGIGLDYWNVTNVVSMQSMFKGSNINVSLSNWGVSNVTTLISLQKHPNLIDLNQIQVCMQTYHLPL